MEHIIATVLILGGAAGIAIIFPNVIAAFSFIGGTGCVFLVFFFPMLIYVKTSKQRWYEGKNLLITITNFILSSLGLIAAILSLLEAMGYITINED